MRKITLRQAINEALTEEMIRDPKVFIMGEDIATGEAYSGVTKDLPEKVGKNRVINTQYPILLYWRGTWCCVKRVQTNC